MAISADTQKAIDHYKQVRDLLGEEDVAFLKAFLDHAMSLLPTFDDGTLCDLDETEEAPDAVRQGVGVLCDILDPEGIAEQDEGFCDGDDTEDDIAA
jgi:hypothetical protein